MCIREAGAWGLMAAYNKVNGVYSTESYFLLMSILKNEWGFRGLAISDWSTQMTVTGSENSGLDVEMPDNAQYSLLPGQVTSKKLSQDSLDETRPQGSACKSLGRLYDHLSDDAGRFVSAGASRQHK